MFRWMSFSLILLSAALSAQAHFVFVVPQSDKEAVVILSENLEADKRVEIDTIKGVTIQLRDSEGNTSDVELTNDTYTYKAPLAGKGDRVVFGKHVLGVYGHGDKPGNLVTYYPKAVVGDAFASTSIIAADHPAEIIPIGAPGNLQLQLLCKGRIQPNADIVVIMPDGEEKKMKTNAAGLTPVIEQTGKIGAWARVTLGGEGEHDGKAFAQSRGYATLAINVKGKPAAGAVAEKDNAPQIDLPETTQLPTMPYASASFGAVGSDGYVYLYGGHIVKAHNYDTESVTGDFYRMSLADASSWEKLPAGQPVQGMNIASHDGNIYRIGGMQPRNAPGDKADNYSVADCSVFNTKTGHWEWLPPMPHARSSHDVAIIDNKLYVFGGWTMNGRTRGNDWCTTGLVLDLSADTLVWKEVEQPWVRRALIAGVHEKKIYMMGGMDDGDEISRNVDVFDTTTGKWSQGPQLPGDSQFVGFSPAACNLNGKLYVSVADGSLYRLGDDASAWSLVGKAESRIVHRMVAFDDKVVILGGASRGGMKDSVEMLKPHATGVIVKAPESTPASSPTTQPSQRTSQKPEAEKSVQVASSTQTLCPIMTDVEVAGDPDAIEVDYMGTKVLICCSKCASKWEKDPAAYLDTTFLPQLKGMDLPKCTLQQVRCPVYPERVVSEKDPFVEYEGKKIYLFNNAAVRRFNADPKRYLDPKILPQLAGNM